MVRDDGDEVACVSSTQVGKTFAYVCKILARAWENPGAHPYWWTAPIYKQSKVAQRLMYFLTTSAGIRTRGPRPPFEQNPPPPLVLLNGGTVEYRTWDNPDNLMGDPVAGVVVDEAGLLPPDANAAISSRLSYTLGPKWYIGNPGKVAGPFRKICARLEASGRLHKWTWRTLYAWLAATDPPRAARYRAFIDRERDSLPDYEFRRLYDAEWTEDEAAVFRNVSACLRNGGLLEPDGDRYVIGVDVGQSIDYMAAVSIGYKSRRLELREHFRGVSYPQAAVRLQELQKNLNDAPIVLEINGPGVAVAQEFDRIGVDYIPFTTTRQSKQEVILSLAADVQNARVEVADIAPLPYELTVFRYSKTTSGSYKYSAPEGEHDDTVIASALASWGLRNALLDLSSYGWIG